GGQTEGYRRRLRLIKPRRVCHEGLPSGEPGSASEGQHTAKLNFCVGRDGREGEEEFRVSGLVRVAKAQRTQRLKRLGGSDKGFLASHLSKSARGSLVLEKKGDPSTHGFSLNTPEGHEHQPAQQHLPRISHANSSLAARRPHCLPALTAGEPGCPVCPLHTQ